MRKHRLSFTFFAVLAATCHAAPDALKETTCKDTLMAFSMPGDPVASVQTVDSPSGPIAVHIYLLPRTNGTLVVSASVYPDNALDPSPAKVLAVARDGAMNNIEARVISEKKITIDNCPGLEFQYESDRSQGICRICLAGTRVYQVNSFSRKGTPLMPCTDQFFASFHLLKP